MTRQYQFTDNDRLLETACYDLIETATDRLQVDFWVEQLKANTKELGSHILRTQARQHLRIFKEKRGKAKR